MVCLKEDTMDPFEIIVGTYEQYLLGYKVKSIVNGDCAYKMEKSFATHSHLASVRCVANKKHYLASGGADDSVYLYDMRYRIESGRLMHHNDTVNCVEFTPEASHLFTCSNDGSIAAIRCGNWQLEKHWLNAHKGAPVNALAIHPTGKLALSTGADGVLRTWNLIKGRQLYATNLVPRLKLDAKNVTVLKWSPSGDKYLLAVNQRIDIYSVDVAGIDDEVKFESKIVCVEFLRNDLIAVGLENGQIKLYDLEKSAKTIEMLAHDIRVKCIEYKDDLLVTASSSGEIKLWKYANDKLDILHTVNCGTRITCLTLAMPCKSLVNQKEIKVKEEDTVKEKKKFRLRQEVVIEDEDDDEEKNKDKREDDDDDDSDSGGGNWEVTPAKTSITPSLTMKSKKKRQTTEVEEIETPKAKKLKSNNCMKKKRSKTPNDGKLEAKQDDENGIRKKKCKLDHGTEAENTQENKGIQKNEDTNDKWKVVPVETPETSPSAKKSQKKRRSIEIEEAETRKAKKQKSNKFSKKESVALENKLIEVQQGSKPKKKKQKRNKIQDGNYANLER